MNTRKRHTEPVSPTTKRTEHSAVTFLDGPKDDFYPLREESLRWAFSIVGGVMVFMVIAVLLTSLYHPDISALRSSADAVLISSGAAQPKPFEAMLFHCAVVFIIPSMLGFYALLSKGNFIKILARKPWFEILSVLFILLISALAYMGLSAPNPFAAVTGGAPITTRDLIGKTNFDFYFSGFFLGTNLWVYLLAIVPAISLFFFNGIRKHNWESRLSYKITTMVLLGALLVIVVPAIVAMNCYEWPYTNQNKIDFNAVYFSMTQVYAGLPMAVNHFTNTYGLYPQFLNPLFQLIGLSILKFSIVMSLLTGIAFFLNFFFLKRLVHSSGILILGFASVLFFPYLQFKLSSPFDSVFSYYPIRYLLPSLLACLAVVYFEKKSRLLYLAISAAMPLFILWNPEMGLVCYFSWLVVNLYSDFYSTGGAINIKPLLRHILTTVLMPVIIFLSYSIVIYLCYGHTPDLSLLFSTILVFAHFAFDELPMSLVHPWNLMALTMMIGFLYSLVNLYRKNITPRATLVLLLSLLSLGYFVYYEGRSHNYNFSISSGFGLMLLTVLGDDLWTIVKKSNVLFLNILFVAFLCVITFSFVELLSGAADIRDLVFQEKDRESQIKEQQRMAGNKDFFITNSKEGQKLLLFTSVRSEGLYYDGNKRRSAVTPGLCDLFLKADLKRIENTVRDSSFDVFIEPVYSNYAYLAHALALMAATYDVNTTHSSMSLLKKRKTKIPLDIFFNRPAALVHQKYADDSTSANLRAADAAGMNAVTLDPEFSVEILFYSMPQIYDGAILVGNTIDSNGFVMGNLFNSPDYFLAVSGTGCKITMPYYEWTYCVMNVFPDRMDIYRNGKLIAKCAITKPIHNTPKRLYIGNFVSAHYYVGAISEVAINSQITDSTQVRQTWGEISKSVNR